MTKSALTYCGQMVREQDPDRFLLSLMAPARHRGGLWALFGFNCEIAKVRESVTEAMLGRIRLQWWREALARIYEGAAAPEHPVVRDLAQIIAKYNLPRAEFDALIDAREFDMENQPHGTPDSFLDYTDRTSTPLTRLSLRVLGEDPDHPSVKIISMNYAIAGLIRAAPFLERQGRRILPDHISAQDAAAYFIFKVKAPARFLRAMQKLAKLYMREIEKAGYNPAHMQPPFFKEIRVLAASIF